MNVILEINGVRHKLVEDGPNQVLCEDCSLYGTICGGSCLCVMNGIGMSHYEKEEQQ